MLELTNFHSVAKTFLLIHTTFYRDIENHLKLPCFPTATHQTGFQNLGLLYRGKLLCYYTNTLCYKTENICFPQNQDITF